MKKFKVSSLATVVSAVIYGTSAQAAEPTELTVTNPASYDGIAYIVTSGNTLDFNQQDVVFTKNNNGDNIRLQVDVGGAIKNVKDLTINGDGFKNNGSITMSGKFTFREGNGKISNETEGTMEVGSLYSDRNGFKNKGILTVNDGVIYTTEFENAGTIISGKDTLNIKYNFVGFTLKVGGKLQSKSGNFLNLVFEQGLGDTPPSLITTRQI